MLNEIKYLDELFLVGHFSLDIVLDICSDLFLHEVVLLLDSLDFYLAFLVQLVETCWLLVQQRFAHVIVHLCKVCLEGKIMEVVSEICWEIYELINLFFIIFQASLNIQIF